MFNNKKSLFVFKFLIRIIISLAVIFLVLVPACGKIRAAFFNTDTKYIGSFEEFVGEINQLSDEPSGTGKRLSLELNKKSAIIGFSEGADHWECFNCNIGKQDRPSAIVLKPIECGSGACICLCNGDYKLRSGDWEGKSASFGECEKGYLCRELEVDIVSRTIVEKHNWGTEDWNNGFLFANKMPGTGLVLNGLKHYKEDFTTLFVQKGDNEIGVCNEDMLDHNKDKLNLPDGVCINKYWAP